MPRLRPIPEHKPAEKPPEGDAETLEALKPEPELADEPEIEIEEPEDEHKPQPEVSDADAALRKQIDEIRRSEEAQRQQLVKDREEALRKAEKAEKRVSRYERESFDQEDTALKAAISAAKAEAEKALSDIRAAKTEGDIEAEIQATDRLTDAKANLSVLRRGREELDIKRKEYKREIRKQEKRAEKAAEAAKPGQYPPHVQEWLNKHPVYMHDIVENSRLITAYHQSAREGYAPYSVEQLGRIEELLHIAKENQQEHKTNERASIMSAPVSREAPAGGGRSPTKVTLTRDEKEAARVSGVSEVEYAKQKQRYLQDKAAGEYGGQ